MVACITLMLFLEAGFLNIEPFQYVLLCLYLINVSILISDCCKKVQEGTCSICTRDSLVWWDPKNGSRQGGI